MNKLNRFDGEIRKFIYQGIVIRSTNYNAFRPPYFSKSRLFSCVCLRFDRKKITLKQIQKGWISEVSLFHELVWLLFYKKETSKQNIQIFIASFCRCVFCSYLNIYIYIYIYMCVCVCVCVCVFINIYIERKRQT